MRIALTGASSTGKTTLANALVSDSEFQKYATKIIKVDARRIIESYGCRNIDEMTRDQLQDFEINYFAIKKTLEDSEQDYLAERSFIDIAAFWIVRDTWDLTPQVQNRLLEPCRIENMRYDLTVYLPFGLFPFEYDGYRSELLDFHKAIDKQILNFLNEWKMPFVSLYDIQIRQRVMKVMDTIRSINESNDRK